MESPINIEFSRRERTFITIKNLIKEKLNLDKLKIIFKSNDMDINKTLAINYTTYNKTIKVPSKPKGTSISYENHCISFPHKHKYNFNINLSEKPNISKIGIFRNFKQESNNFLNLNNVQKVYFIQKKIYSWRKYQNKRNEISNLNEKINSIEEFLNQKFNIKKIYDFSNVVFEDIDINHEFKFLNLIENFLKQKSDNYNNKILYY